MKKSIQTPAVSSEQLHKLSAQAFRKGSQSSYQELKAIMTTSKNIGWLLNTVTDDANTFSCFCSILRQAFLKGTYTFFLKEQAILARQNGTREHALIKFRQQCISALMSKIIGVILITRWRQQEQLFKLSIEAMGALVKEMVQTLSLTKENIQQAIKEYLYPLVQENTINAYQNPEESIDYRIYVVIKIIESCLVSINNFNYKNRQFQHKVSLLIFKRHVARHFHEKIVQILDSRRESVTKSIMFLDSILKIAEQIIVLFKAQERPYKLEGMEIDQPIDFYFLPQWFLDDSFRYFQIFETLYGISLKQKRVSKTIDLLSIMLNLTKIWTDRTQISQGIIQNQKKVLKYIGKLMQSRMTNEIIFNIESNVLCIILFVVDRYSFSSLRYLLNDPFILRMLKYFELVMNICPVKVLEGQGNPSTYIFRIFHQVYTMFQSSDLKLAAQNLLRIFSTSIVHAQPIDEDFPSYTQQIDLYKSCFKSMASAFNLSSTENIRSIKGSNLKLGDSNKHTTMFFIMMVQRPQTQKQHCELLLYLYEKLSKEGGFCFLYVIDKIIRVLMAEGQFCKYGSSISYLWAIIFDKRSINFETFIAEIIGFVTETFIKYPPYLIDFGLSILNYICTQVQSLQWHFGSTNQQEPQNYKFCTKLIQKFIRQNKLANIKNSFHHRLKLYEIIGMLWAEGDTKAVFQIYEVVRIPLTKSNPKRKQIMQYLIDCTGLVKSMKKRMIYTIAAEIICQDFPTVLNFLFGTQERKKDFLLNLENIEIYLKFIEILTKDDIQRITGDLYSISSILLYQTFYPGLKVLENMIKIEDLEDELMRVYLHMAHLTTLDKLLPIPAGVGFKKGTIAVLKSYFSQLHRMQDEQVKRMFQYAHLSIQFFKDWTEQMIDRRIPFDMQFDIVNRFMLDKFSKTHDIIDYGKIMHYVYRSVEKDYKLKQEETIQAMFRQAGVSRK